MVPQKSRGSMADKYGTNQILLLFANDLQGKVLHVELQKEEKKTFVEDEGTFFFGDSYFRTACARLHYFANQIHIHLLQETIHTINQNLIIRNITRSIPIVRLIVQKYTNISEVQNWRKFLEFIRGNLSVICKRRKNCNTKQFPYN